MNSGYETLQVTSRGLTLHAKVWGNKKHRPVLALHGWLDNSNSYDKLVPFLHDVYVIALDLPGHGLSCHRSPDAEYHFLEWVQDIANVVHALQLNNCVLMGHSMGASIASITAGTLVDTFSHIICLDGLPPFHTPAALLPQALKSHIETRHHHAQRAMRPYPTKQLMAQTLIRVVPNLSFEHAMLLIERGAKEVAGGFVWRYDARLRRGVELYLMQEQIDVFLRAIKAPLLLVRATDGLPMDASELARLMGLIPNSRQVDLTGGHHVHMEDPASVAYAINHFLAEAF